MFLGRPVLFLLALSLSCLCGEELDSFSEKALKTSSLWRSEGPLLVLKKGANAVPEFFLQFVRRKLSEEGSPARLVEVECPDGESSEDGRLCSLLSEHQVAMRLSGAGDDVVGRSFPLEDYLEETEFLVHILESLVGGSLTHIKDHSSLTDFLSEHAQALVVLTSEKSTANYSSFLVSYQLHTPGVPLAVTSSPSSLPLTKRPRHTGSSTPLYLWNILQNGATWFAWPGIVSFRNFLIRTKYPDKIAYEENEDILNEFRKQGVSFALMFSPLPAFGSFSFDKFIEKIVLRIYPLFVVVTVDREKSRKLAKRFFVTDSKLEGHVAAVPYGNEQNIIGIDLATDNAEEEAYHMVVALSRALRDSDMVSTLQEGDFLDSDGKETPVEEVGTNKATISTMDFSSMGIAMEHFKTDLMFVFCKQDTKPCQDDLYFILEKVYKAVLQTLPSYVIHFFVVGCRSVENVKKYKLEVLPSYALYHRANRTMVPGTGDVYDQQDIMSLIVEVTGHTELNGVEAITTKADKDNDEFLSQFHPELSNLEYDVYGRIAQTLPYPNIPKELVLTSENFAERIGKYERMAVMFYMRWSVKSKVALFHLIEAHGRLEKKNSVALGSVACDSYTDLCTRYKVTTYPTILIFTPSTLSSPSPLQPSIGVINSVELLKALSNEEDPQNTLMEISPTTFPAIMKRSLRMPLVIWCDSNKPSSDLGTVFTDVATSDTSGRVAYAWLNCKKYGSLLEEALEIPKGSGCPNVFGFQLNKRAVYQLETSVLQLDGSGFKTALINFVQQLKGGKLQPTKILPEMDWSPAEPPIKFPSEREEAEEEDSEEESEDADEDADEYKAGTGTPDVRDLGSVGEMDTSIFPPAEPPMFEDFDESLPDSELDKIMINASPDDKEEDSQAGKKTRRHRHHGDEL